MSMNLQIRNADNLRHIGQRIATWLDARPGYRGAHLTNVAYIEGSGSSAETVTAELLMAGQARRHVVIRLLSNEMRPYLDTRLERQIRILDWLRKNTDLPVAQILASDLTGAAAGRPFLLMQRIFGQAAADFPGYNKAGFIFDMEEDARRRLWEDALDMMSRIALVDHSTIDFLDYPGTESAELPDVLTHWGNSLEWAREDLPHDFYRDVLRWLRREMPLDPPKGLSWGDARPGNMLFRDGRCVAVLDWEMSSLAGPVLDLAWWLLFDRIQDEDSDAVRLPGLGSRQETIDRWMANTGLPTDDLRWYEILSLFQLSITRGKSFGDRRRHGWAVPDADDTRSVTRLRRRIEALL